MADPTGDTPPAATSSLVPMLAAVVSLLVGAAGGFFVLAPKLAGGAAPAAEAEGEHGEGGSAKAPVLYTLQNVIVNPAGSQGQRYIVATIAYELPDEETRNVLHAAETQLRDGVTGVLERKTVEQLLQAGARDALRGEFEQVAAPYLKGVKTRVFIPQFLIQ